MTCRIVLVIIVSSLVLVDMVEGLNGQHIRINSIIVPNKMRYSSQADSQLAMPTIEQAITSQEPRFADVQVTSKYQINRGDITEAQKTTSRYEELDNEDKSLLDQFYRETRNNDPFEGDSLVNSQDLWNEHLGEELSDVFLGISSKRPPRPHQADINQNSANRIVSVDRPANQDWTIDTRLLMINNHANDSQSKNLPQAMTRDVKVASYSPIHRLLTSYDPIEEKLRSPLDLNQAQDSRGDRVVGATLYSKDQLSKPVVSSKSSKQAVKLHDDLFEEPPKDGIARLRMYFHRAIHDDIKLYGTGPWKYWGHGWGVEFGFNPRDKLKPNFYQKGYTIERAYGRDFCKDKSNCRPPDPNFLKYMSKIRIKPNG
jgi:hypothetical protein